MKVIVINWVNMWKGKALNNVQNFGLYKAVIIDSETKLCMQYEDLLRFRNKNFISEF
jgi:hypothetical protein